MIVLIDGVRYQLLTPENEAWLEKAIQCNSEHIFGPDSFYFDIKKKIRSKAGVASIPDGYVIFFTPKPRWAIIEVELASHPVYDHVIPQLSKFNKGIEDNSTRKNLVEILYGIFDDDEVLKARLKQKIKTGEIYKFISDLVSEQPLIIVAIDQRTEELNEAIDDIKGEVKVVEFKTFRREGLSEDVNAYMFEPLCRTPIVASIERKTDKFDSSFSSGTVKINTVPGKELITSLEAGYRAKYRKQLNNPNSMASKIRSYVQERGEVRYRELEEFLVHKWGYKISGSVGACLTILEKGNYIEIVGKGDDKVLRAKKSRA